MEIKKESIIHISMSVNEAKILYEVLSDSEFITLSIDDIATLKEFRSKLFVLTRNN